MGGKIESNEKGDWWREEEMKKDIDGVKKDIDSVKKDMEDMNKKRRKA